MSQLENARYLAASDRREAMMTMDPTLEFSSLDFNRGAPGTPTPDEHPGGPGPKVMDAASLAGDSVVNAAGEHLGTIKAIMLDVPAGRVAYAVLSFGGFLGAGDKLSAIPWPVLKLDPLEKRFVFDVSKERLEAAPGFDKEHWPRMADREWATGIHQYYDVPPYWEEESGWDERDDTLAQSSG
jgi:sporulation protein YlmC with PRC-barrel domain